MTPYPWQAKEAKNNGEALKRALFWEPRTLKRFFEKVEPMLDARGCWEWTGALTSTGYGVIGRGKRGEGNWKAHRLSYEIHFGPTDGFQVNHHCDNRTCVNPAHLYLGSQKDNTRDCITRKRFKFLGPRPGERNAAAKLTQAQVDEIRSIYGGATKTEWSHGEVAKQYGVSYWTISKIVRGKSW